MKSNQIEVGATYSAKVSGQLVPVQVVELGLGGGFWAKNLQTGRTIRLKSARRLRGLLKGSPTVEAEGANQEAPESRYEDVDGLPRWARAAMNDRWVPGTWTLKGAQS